MKSLVSMLIILIIAASLSACGGDPLISSSSSLGQFLANIQVVHHPTPIADGTFPDYTTTEGREFENDQGFMISLTMAALSYHKITLVSGGDDPDCIEGHDVALELHQTEDLLGEDLLTSQLGQYEIENRAFCSYEVTLAPHDGEAEESAIGNLTDDHHGTTVHLMGSWSKEGDSGNFMIEFADEIVASASFQAKVDGVKGEHALHFHEGETELTVVFGTKYDLLFKGVDFELDDAATLIQKVIDNIQSGGVHQHLGAHHSS